MASDGYRLQPSDNVLLHGRQPAQLLHDNNQPHDVDALVASGDCLITLATALDETAALLAAKPDIARSQIETVVQTLLQLQRHYLLTRKPTDGRQ